MQYKKILFISLVITLTTSLYSFVTAAEYAVTAQKNQLTKQAAAEKKWLFLLSADRGRIRQQKDRTLYELSLTDIDKGVVAITDEPFRETKMIPSNHFLKGFNKIFANGSPNAVLTYSGLLTGKTSPPIAIIIQSVTVIPNIKVVLSVHPLSANIDIPKGNISEVKLFID